MGISDTIYTFRNDLKVMSSRRIIEGIATTPRVDRENESVTAEAIAEALPEFMNNGADITFYHKEFIVGKVELAYQTDSGELFVRCRLFETADVDEVWELIKTGVVRSFSITFRRVEVNPQCRISPRYRTSPCITSKLYLRSITLCPVPCNPDATFEIVDEDIGQKGSIMSPEEDIITSVPSEGVKMEIPNVGNKEDIITHSMSGDKPLSEVLSSGDVAQKFVEALMPAIEKAVDSAIAAKSCGEGKKEEEEEEKTEPKEEDVGKKSIDSLFETFESRIAKMESNIEALLNQPVGQKGYGVIDEQGNPAFITGDGKKVDPRFLAMARQHGR